MRLSNCGSESVFENLSDRQKLLIERLIEFGRMASERELPFDVVEILGFGSFFRGKERPKDVDLFLRCERQPLRTDFVRFIGLLRKVRYDPEYQGAYETPKEAMRVLYERSDAPRLPGFNDGELEQQRFCEWLDGYSWNMLYPQTIHEQAGMNLPDDFAKRLVRRRVPNLNVVSFVNHDDPAPMSALRCGFTVSVWSKDRLEVSTNLAELLSPERLTQNTLQELRYFEVQFPAVQAELKLLEAEIELLFRIAFPQSPPQRTWEWHEEWVKDREELRDLKKVRDKARRAADRFDNEDWGSPISPPYMALTHKRALAMTESLRKEIKDAYQKIDLLEELQGSLARYQSGNADSSDPVENFVATDVLSRGNARQRKRMEALLVEIGIPIRQRPG